MDKVKFAIIQRKGVTITRKRKDLPSYLADGWEEVTPEIKKPVVNKKKEGTIKNDSDICLL